MSARFEPLTHRRIRAPREHGQTLIQPSLAEVGELLADNQLRATSPAVPAWLDQLRAPARKDLIEHAVRYTKQYREVDSPRDSEAPLLISGHQPQLFHPGVWLKNFVLARLATTHAGVGINLLVDNDILSSPSIRVPAGSNAAPRIETVPFDKASEPIPFEERMVREESLFTSFSARIAQELAGWISNPLVTDLWRHARAARNRTSNLGECLANARHGLEGEWGLNTLEVPLSRVFGSEHFYRFALQLLRDAAGFRRVYNEALQEYRAVNHIRSRAHPVPDLEEHDGWQEVPLWIWTTERPHRQRLFVRTTSNGIELTDRGVLRLGFPASGDSACEAWSGWERRGIKIRPRALITTMYARLVLSDLFLHGIGGAKYDELTDAIIHRYFGIVPPHYLTVTATVHLPLDRPQVAAEDLLAAQHELRELRFHAERYAQGNGACAELAARKQQLLRDIPPRGAKKQWHREISAVNAALQPCIAVVRNQLAAQAATLAEQYRLSRLLGSREFSFCLFPKDFLRNLLLDLSSANA